MEKNQIQKYIEKGYVVIIQGKPFIKYEGLLAIAEKKGLMSIETEMINVDIDKKFAQFKCTATAMLLDKDGNPKLNHLGNIILRKFVGYGDGSPENINRGVISSFLRVCETRAKARTLRDLCGIGMCSVEELPGNQPQSNYSAKNDKEFLSFCKSVGGYENLKKNLYFNYGEELDLLPKKRILNLIKAINDGSFEIDSIISNLKVEL